MLFFATLVKLLDYIILFTLVLLRPLGGVIFDVVIFITMFYPLSLSDKKGSNFYFWTRIVILTGQVIFVPEWPKGEFVSL